jgi:zinc transporter ZupT
MDYLLLLSTILLGTATVFVFRLERESFIKLLNAFTGAYLLAVTCLHLLPHLYGEAHHDHEHSSALVIGGLMLAGFFVQIALDSISMGVEHGHTHKLHGTPYPVIVGLCAHAFIEATALGEATGAEAIQSRRLLLWSIVIHNYPVTIALAVILLRSGLSRPAIFGWVAVFAAMAPAAMWLGNHTTLGEHTHELTAVVIGIFLHVSTTILFEAEEGHRFNLKKAFAVLLGLGLAALTLTIH